MSSRKHRTLLSMDIFLRSNKSKPYKLFKKGYVIISNNAMEKNYKYALAESPGKNFDPDFDPYYTPKEMLSMGVFEGRYCNDQINEFPREWFTSAIKKGKLSPHIPDPSVNYFGVKSRLSLTEWRSRGWVPCHPDDRDVRGWFEWYMRYWLGRRIPAVDAIQISRWKKFKRHYAQVVKNAKGQIKKRPRQRQALLQWSYKCDV